MIYTVSEGIVTGKSYQFRYRVKNENRWSDFSPITVITAATSPSSPQAPTLNTATSSSILLDFYEPSYNGGSEIVFYELYINDCDQASEPTTLVTGYTDGSSSYSVTTAEFPTLAGGEICAFKYRVINEEGHYADSTIVRVAMADSALAPNAPYKVIDESTETSITVQWDAPTSTQLPGGKILGYRLYMRKANGGSKSIVYENLALNSKRKFTVSNLEAGESYVFSVDAYQFNGFTGESDEVTIYACEKPSLLFAPILVDSDSTFMTLQWSPPLSCGGCPVNGYALFMDDGNSGTLAEIDSATIANDPTILSHSITSFTSSDIGLTFMFKLEVFTDGGQTESDEVGYLLASAPEDPTVAPTAIVSMATTSALIKISAAPITADGGSTITSYSIEVDDGQGGEYTALFGTSSDSLSVIYTLRDVIEGLTYRIRYRSKNIIGWSGYSPIQYAIVMDVPEPPASIAVVSVSDTSIVLSFSECEDNNGGQVEYYTLYRNNGTGTTDLVTTSAYDGTTQFNVNTTSDSDLVVGITYTFYVTAHNDAGESELSDGIAVALARVPEQIAVPIHNTAKSTRTKITVKWTKNTDIDSPGGNVLGFKLYMATSAGGDYNLVYTTYSPSITQYSATGLTPGEMYKFKVLAYNYNGEGPLSDALITYACEDVSDVYPPVYESASNDNTTATMTVTWSEPGYDGSCPVLSYALYMDDGLNGTLVEVNVDNDPDIRDQPTLRSATITTLAPSDIGTDYSLQLKVQTVMGWYESDIVSITFATIPEAPSTAPQEISASSSQVTVSYVFTETGGSPILDHNLQYGEGLAGSFTDLISAGYLNMANTYTLKSVTEGQTYYFRYRVKNMYGWSDWSQTGYATASEVPGQASTPEIASYSNDTIELNLNQDVANGGDPITSYRLEWATGTTPTESDYSTVASYDGTSSTFTLPSGSDTITAGVIYNFRYYASNSRGEGTASDSTSIGATLDLDPPTGLAKVASKSTSTKIYLTWDPVTPVYTPADNILGYRLYAIDSDTTDVNQFELIFDGQVSGMPSNTFYSYNGLITGQRYWFKVSVLTNNGESQLSDRASAYACVAPSGMTVPSIDSVTLSSITISWTAPTSSGGCAITGYDILLDSGNGFTEVNLSGSTVVTLGVGTYSYVITEFDGALTGDTVDIKVRAYNVEYSSDSPSKSVLIATVPDAPLTLVTKVGSNSNEKQVTVQFDALSTTEANGSPIISYSLEYRLGSTGDFTVYSGADGLATLIRKFTLTSTYVTKGNTYAFRYRAKNSYGWGDYSEISYITVAGAPATPDQLIVVVANSSLIEIELPGNGDDGGSPITAYEVSYAEGLTATTFSAFPNCDGTTSTCDLPLSLGLTVGAIYKFTHRALNAISESDFSTEISIGLIDLPAQVTGVTKLSILSSRTTVTLTWDLVADDVAPAGVIKGYRVYMVTPDSNDEILVFDGEGQAHVNSATITDLTESYEYKFTIAAVNYNGEGTRSDEYITHA